jgi:acyl carrier protein phosphodiesterase
LNFLAHIYLSGENPEVVFGNFIGDGVKGNQSQSYSPNVQKGIALHRFIDEYTDNHPLNSEARKLIRPHFRKYSGVVLDMYFDHFLSVNWEAYHTVSLETYADETHRLLNQFEHQMPEKTKRFFHYMKMYNWLVNYRDVEKLRSVFNGMAGRTSFESNMEIADKVLVEHYQSLENTFGLFFPDLQESAIKYRRTLK